MIVDTVLNNVKAYVSGEIKECSIAIHEGKIFKLGKKANMPKAETVINLKGFLVLPGMIDVHVHLRDEGKAYKEDFYTGTAAAAAGGVTTVLDMPNNKPVTMSAETLRNRIRIAEGKILVNVGFYSAFPKNLEEIEKIVNTGAFAFKFFMAAEIGGLKIGDEEMVMKAFKKAGELGIPVAVHAEDWAMLREKEEKLKLEGCNSIEAFLEVHSEKAEVEAVKKLVKIVKQTNVQTHLCHLTTRKGLEILVEAKRAELPLTCEVTPHHLFLSIDDLKKIGTLAVTVPPFREKADQKALWFGIRKGWIDIIASDHAPHFLTEKKVDDVWSVKVGVPGLETTLPLLLTEVNNGRLTIKDLVRLTSEKPAEIFDLNGKGKLENGMDADLVVVDLHREFKIDASNFHSKAKFSPFDGWKVKGKPVKTFVNGILIMDEDSIIAKPGTGKVLKKGCRGN
ncbi:dihydroorotase family protein [Candidatus Bathyarchaeota archaeon]|nr:dihydroorotase family protein [Candidatus Bathyarchaeota archaeon]